MTMAALAARSVESLPKLDAARMELTNALLKLLSDGMDVAVVREIPDMKAFVTDEGFAFALLSEPGSCMLGNDDSVDHACDVLDVGDALLRHVEERLGVRIEPVAIRRAAQTFFGSDGSIVLRIGDAGRTLLLALESDTPQRFLWIEMAQAVTPDLSSVPVALSIAFEAAKLPVAEAAQVEGGDLLLLPRRVRATWQRTDEQPPGNGTLDLTAMTIQPGGGYDEEESRMSDDDATYSPAAFQVPVTVRLPVQYVNAAALAGLRAGGSLQLGPLAQGLPVELLVGGRRIGAGEIVEIGENFAVLVDERDDPPAAAEITGETDAETAGEIDLRMSMNDPE